MKYNINEEKRLSINDFRSINEPKSQSDVFFVNCEHDFGSWISKDSYDCDKFRTHDNNPENHRKYDPRHYGKIIYTYKHRYYYFDINGNELPYKGCPDYIQREFEIRETKHQQEKIEYEKSLPPHKGVDHYNRYSHFHSTLAIPVAVIISIISIIIFNQGWDILFLTVPYCLYGLYQEITYETKWRI